MYAASATTWAAIGALATLLTALITLGLGLLYSSRQTEYARRSASNAKVSAEASVAAARLAEKHLELVTQEVAVVRAQTAAAERQVELARLALTSQDRHAFVLGRLTYDARSKRFTATLTNDGRGAGWITRACLVRGPDASGMVSGIRAIRSGPIETVAAGSRTGVVAVGGSVELTTDAEIEAQAPALYWMIVVARDASGQETWTYFFVFRVRDPAVLATGRELGGMFASRGSLIAKHNEVQWPSEDELRQQSPARTGLDSGRAVDDVPEVQ